MILFGLLYGNKIFCAIEIDSELRATSANMSIEIEVSPTVGRCVAAW